MPSDYPPGVTGGEPDIVGAAIESPFNVSHWVNVRTNKARKIKNYKAYTVQAKYSPMWTGAHFKTYAAACSFWTYATLRAVNGR